MRESQPRHVVHTYYALERGQFDSVIHLWFLELLGNVVNFREVDRSKILVFQISARPRSRRGGAEQGPVFAVVVVDHRLQGCGLSGRSRNPPPFASIWSRS